MQNLPVMACSHCTGPGTGLGMGNDGFLYYAVYCTHYTVTGTGNHCFLLCLSRSLSLSRSGPVQCVWAITHKRNSGWKCNAFSTLTFLFEIYKGWSPGINVIIYWFLLVSFNNVLYYSFLMWQNVSLYILIWYITVVWVMVNIFFWLHEMNIWSSDMFLITCIIHRKKWRHWWCVFCL